jgi:hypothetical protein
MHACLPAIVRHEDGGVEYVPDDAVELCVVREAPVAAAAATANIARHVEERSCKLWSLDDGTRLVFGSK